MNLSVFQNNNLFEAGTEFFGQLGIALNSNTSVSLNASELLKDQYKDRDIFKNLSETYFLGLVDDSIFDKNVPSFDKTKISYEEATDKIHEEYNGIMVFGVKLSDAPIRSPLPTGQAYSPKRSEIAELTRAFNRASKNIPVVLLLQYGSLLSFATSERTQYKQQWREGEKIGKVSLLKDINVVSPHTGHLKILYDLKVKPEVASFDTLYRQWRKVFDVQLLNKKFYQELAIWYFWAVKKVTFPDDTEKDEEVRNATSVIRLITRLIFIWFVKEKGLIPDDLFNQNRLKGIINYTDTNNSTYYKAILQNLFFATLNTEMNKDKPDSRKFRHKAREQGQRDQHYMIHNVFRHADCFINPQDTLKKYFENIPFLNGGLFECLDKKVTIDDKDKVIRIDGFSDRKDNVLTVPDELFFSAEQKIDLNETFGTKNKTYKVRGLINILNSYKFTITENTPVEEEIALDPELLGKVFENLLASYNPETQTTARKQTGSFYTPREIVNYMVDESLIAYLDTQLKEKIPAFRKMDSLDEVLREVLDYTEKTHPFNDDEINAIIEAIDNAKILDPACGSGAFPMGVLHKMVHVLHKLDPDNEKWKQRQIDKVDQLIRDAENIEDITTREKIIKDLEANKLNIEDAFENNELDYGRKLYLIENCIYGVDIQPIAVQIAKLRFFISLIVDQRITPEKQNLGILPLPNLETKFVAANTLIGIEKPQEAILRNPEIDRKEEELKKVRDHHFTARTPKTKEKYRKEDEHLRKEIAELLKRDGFLRETTEKLTQWNPYDQNASADFFDPEWMFSVRTGFDITIGNPPYVRADSGEEHLALRKQIIDSGYYETLWEKWDLFIPFMERSYKLLRQDGITSLIVSDAYCHAKYAQKSQEWFLRTSRILKLDFLSKIKVFDAGVHNVIYFYQKATGDNNKPVRRVHENDFCLVNELPTDEQQNLTFRAFFPEVKTSQSCSVPVTLLNDICYITKGMVVHANERTAKGAFEMKDLVVEAKDTLHPKPFVEGKHLDIWLPSMNKWLEWGTKWSPSLFSRPTFPEIYEVDEKILVQRSPGPDPKACFDNQHLHFTESSVGFILWHKFSGVKNKSLKKVARYKGEKPLRPDLPQREELEKISSRFNVKYLLAIMNSAFAKDFLRSNRRSNIHLYPDDWKKLPIPEATTEQQQPVIHLVDHILTAKQKDPQADTTALENKIDVMVYKLYGLTYEEVKIIDPEFEITEEKYNQTEEIKA